MIHHVLVGSVDGKILLTRHYDTQDPMLQQERESQLFLLTSAELASMHDGEFKIATSDDKFIVYRRVSNVVVFITTSSPYEELACQSMVDTFSEVLKELSPKKDVNAATFGNIFAKAVVCLDDMVHQGLLVWGDKDTILSMSKLTHKDLE